MSNETQPNPADRTNEAESANTEPTPRKKPQGLRIWLKDFTKITESTTVKDRDGNVLSGKDINIDEIIDICKGIQKNITKGLSSIFILNEEIPTDKPPVIFHYGDAEKYTADRYVGIIMDEHGNQIFIGSRFDRNEEQQWFLQYVFSQAFDATGKIIKKMNPIGKYETTWDWLIMFMFIQRLKEAFRKGIFRRYRQFLHNDFNVKGQIDIARYIKLDIPENGRIAYRTREYTPDNYYNILFLRALNEMEKRNPQLMRNLLANNPEVKKTLSILRSSIPDWNTVSIQKVLKNTERKITHSIYRNYEQLRVISRIILRRLGFNAFNPNKEKAMGIVIDMPKLWEKFLEKTVVSHLSGYTPQYSRSILNGKRTIIPDFYLKDQKLVLDAKYKNNWKKTIDDDRQKNKWTEEVRDDVFQIMGYMLSLECKAGGVICPYQCKDEEELDKKRKSFYDRDIEKLSVFPEDRDSSKEDRYFFRLPYFIPNYEGMDSFSAFKDEMQKNAEKMAETVKKYIEDSP